MSDDDAETAPASDQVEEPVEESVEEPEVDLPVLRDVFVSGEDAASPEAWDQALQALAGQERQRLEQLLQEYESDLREQVESALRARLSGALEQAISDSTREVLARVMAELPARMRDTDTPPE